MAIATFNTVNDWQAPAELYSADGGENCLSVDTAATQNVRRPKFGSGFQRRGIEADLQRYANALPSLVCVAANSILLDLGLGTRLSPFNEDEFSRVRVRPEMRY